MKVMTLAGLYLVVGVALAGGLTARRGLGRQTALDGALLVICWPLCAPFVFGRTAARTPLLDALAALRDGPLAALLPDPAALDRLADRLARATARAAELEALTRRPEFDPVAAEARAAQLDGAGRHGAADAARRTAAHLRRLAALRDRADAELAEVEERLHQLRAQAEVMRLSGQSGDAARLVGALTERIEALDDALLDPVLCPAPDAPAADGRPFDAAA